MTPYAFADLGFVSNQRSFVEQQASRRSLTKPPVASIDASQIVPPNVSYLEGR
jgi:hypothetical protein